MIPIKKSAEIAKMRESCQIAARVLERVVKQVEPGVNTYDLDNYAKELMAEYGAASACYNYRLRGRTFPRHTCLSINEEVVHGIGRLERVLREGDSITVDVCVNYNGWIGDNARTVPVGSISPEIEFLLSSTEAALYQGISKAIAGNRVRDISRAVQRFVEERKLSVVREFVGHGVGRSMHEEPQVPNYVDRNTSRDKLRPGMTIAIEPMVNLGKPEVDEGGDGWTALTRDGKPSAHFEHTVLITENGPEILTKIEK